MPIDAATSALNLSFPPTSSAPGFIVPQSRSFTVSVHPVVFFSILDHYLRRQREQHRVIGTLLGVRNEDGSEVEVRNCFPVPHNETLNQVAVDMEYHQNMFELHKKVNAKEVIVGWYATGSNLNQWNALIHDFYSKEVSVPFQAIHLTMDTDIKNEEKLLGVKTYVSAPIGISAKPENCLFLPVPCDVKYFDAEKSGLNLLASAKDDVNRSTSLISDMDNIEKTLLSVQDMLERIINYTNKDGSVLPNSTIGRFLMDSISVVPTIDKKEFEKMFYSHLQDLLMVDYLANLTRTQLAIAEKLQLLEQIG
ncbi:14175_t:CDS:2 [Entrophospora sp. SA101]|nr:8502_t:CDS:2 [Entrophospora candida]CAH1757796.1 5954_t:CDS:2 [Entrophospora sp. SA101]CAJ0768056.1 14175_t:CDS:2 [Entrophospora sp. SA101]CAJ0835263.1 4271_t:CDS:2 [Entrophospora sp. SA101]CAJ0837713.1 2039_t:CDS:2 [Entrophospora sp. SA101]